MSDTCTNCKFCARYPYTVGNVHCYGYECHYNAPVMVEGRYGNWPKVKGTDWCGKWEGK